MALRETVTLVVTADIAYEDGFELNNTTLEFIPQPGKRRRDWIDYGTGWTYGEVRSGRIDQTAFINVIDRRFVNHMIFD